MDDNTIAVIGLAGRFPGADSPSGLWNMLVNGTVGLERTPQPPQGSGDYVPVHGTAAGLDLFDPVEFDMTPREAVVCDPQTRLLLQLVESVFRDAGMSPHNQSDTAVYVSVGHSRYAELFGSIDWRSSRGMSLMTGTNLDYASSLLSYKYGFRGAAMTVQTACSSSLVAVHQACQALLDDQTDIAVAGGANVVLPLGDGYRWEQGGPVSRSGHCLPFDDAADGTIFTSGGALVLLKRLNDAVADRDPIYATIEGSAINNDGAHKAGFTAPSVAGQAAVIAEAMLDAGIGPNDLDMIEGHATGTALGDPIEWQGILRAFALGGGRNVGPCPVTAVKGNVGHLGHASGVASLVKSVLAMRYDTVPAIGGFTTPNTRLTSAQEQLTLPSHNITGDIRHCGVSSFGVGGTNAHVIVGAAPHAQKIEPAAPSTGTTRPVVLALAESSASDNEAYRAAIAALPADAAADAGQVARSLDQVNQSTPAHRFFRCAAVIEPGDDWRDALAAGSRAVVEGETMSGIGWIVPAEGSVPAAGVTGVAGNPHTGPGFAECREAFTKVDIDLDVCASAFTDGDRSAVCTEPLQFAVSHALATAWRFLGVTPDFVAGRGSGEIYAGVVAGLLELDEAARLVAARARALDELPCVSRVSFAGPHERLSQLLSDDDRIIVLADDEKNEITVEAPETVVDDITARAARLGLSARHSECRYPASSPRASEAAERLALPTMAAPPAPDLPVFVSLADTNDDPGTAEYWRRTVAARVCDNKITTRIEAEDAVAMELGAGCTVTALVNRSHKGRAVAMLPNGAETPADVDDAIAAAAARVWVAGHDVDWSALHGSHGDRARLPGRPITGARHWPAPLETPVTAPTAASHVSDTPLSAGQTPGIHATVHTWAPDHGVGRKTSLAASARTLNILVGEHDPRAIEVMARFAPDAPVVRVPDTEDLRNQLESIIDSHADGIGHVILAIASEHTDEPVATQWRKGFTAPAAIAAAFHQRPGPKPDMTVVTTGGIDVTGGEPHRPGLAAVGPLLKTLVAENAIARAAWLDVSTNTSPSAVPRVEPTVDVPIVAVRGARTWTRADTALTDVAQVDETPSGAAYVVTGGAGALAGVLCRHIARVDPRARISLLVRKTRTLTAAHRDAEKLGARLRQEVCDLGDAAAVTEVIDALAADEGRFHGVFHLAGAAGAGVTAIADHSRSAAVRTKVDGTEALVEALSRHAPPRVLVGFSSRAAVGGQPGGADYASANAVMEALLHRAHAERVVSLAWAAWSDIGMAVPYLDRAGAKDRVGITAVDAGPMLERLLTDVLPPSLVIEAVETGNVPHTQEAPRVATEVHPIDVMAPDTEKALVDIWRDLLGIEDIDIDADFFETGGNSLTAVELSSRIEDELGTEIDLIELFDTPTIRQLTQLINKDAPPQPAPPHTPNAAHIPAVSSLETTSAPATPSVEKALIDIWRDLLGIEDIDIDADFFETGGNSLTAVELSSRIEDELGTEIDLIELFDTPTIRQLTQLINKDAR